MIRMVPKFKFGTTSGERLDTCDPKLQRAMHYAMSLQLMDFTILEGHRSQARQLELLAKGATKVAVSKHQHSPSAAIDIAPYPVRWGSINSAHRVKEIGNFYRLAGIVLAGAKEMGIPLRWGGDWNMNGDIYDQEFDDLVHFELVED